VIFWHWYLISDLEKQKVSSSHYGDQVTVYQIVRSCITQNGNFQKLDLSRFQIHNHSKIPFKEILYFNANLLVESYIYTWECFYENIIWNSFFIKWIFRKLDFSYFYKGKITHLHQRPASNRVWNIPYRYWTMNICVHWLFTFLSCFTLNTSNTWGFFGFFFYAFTCNNWWQNKFQR
jgi:hypothetical protein